MPPEAPIEVQNAISVVLRWKASRVSPEIQINSPFWSPT